MTLTASGLIAGMSLRMFFNTIAAESIFLPIRRAAKLRKVAPNRKATLAAPGSTRRSPAQLSFFLAAGEINQLPPAPLPAALVG